MTRLLFITERIDAIHATSQAKSNVKTGQFPLIQSKATCARVPSELFALFWGARSHKKNSDASCVLLINDPKNFHQTPITKN